MGRPEPQTVLSPITQAAIFLVLTFDDGAETEVRALIADVSGIVRAVGFRVPEAELTCVVGIGASAWDRLFGQPRPAELHSLREIAGARHIAVSTPADVLFHIRAHRFDLCFELAQRLMDRLRGHATVVDEVHGFRSFDLRDILGFVDGTENPAGKTATESVEMGDEDPDFSGGSYVLVQKYVHDLASWDAISVEEQERVIGRLKLSDVELADDVKPMNSHVALNTIVDDNGDQQQIVRYNMPFGRVGEAEYGTYFIGYARGPGVLEHMLANMFIGSPPGNTDRILDFSTALTGSLFFVPTADFLDNPRATQSAEEGPAESIDKVQQD